MSTTVIGFLVTLFTIVIGVTAVRNAVRQNKIKHGETEDQLKLDLT